MGESDARLIAARSHLHRAWGAAVDVVFPPRCPGCRRRGTWLCQDCAGKTPVVEWPRCERCGVPSEAACRCGSLHPALDAARAALWYDGWVPSAIQWFKYEGDAARADALGAFLAAEMDHVPAGAIVVPVPLHRRREQLRGYNQSMLLAREAARRRGLPVMPALIRQRNTPRQVGLHADERARNILDAFSMAPTADVNGRDVVVIDDVLTTGATLGECAAVLRRAGATRVEAVVLARER